MLYNLVYHQIQYIIAHWVSLQIRTETHNLALYDNGLCLHLYTWKQPECAAVIVVKGTALLFN